MRTFSIVKGRPVLDFQTGVRLGTVVDLSVTDAGEIEGLLVRTGTLLRRTCLLPLESVNSYGRDVVMADGCSRLLPLKGKPAWTLEHHGRLSGKMVYSREGAELGLLEDVYFSEELGTIVGYELTDGFFSDLMEGKRMIKPVEPPAIGKDAIIVNVETKC